MLPSGVRRGWRIHRPSPPAITSSFFLACLTCTRSLCSVRSLPHQASKSAHPQEPRGAALQVARRLCHLHSSSSGASGQPFSSSSPSTSAVTAAATSDSTTAALKTADASPSFLSALLEPQETIPLVDTTRTYTTMDVVGPCEVYDPLEPNVTASNQQQQQQPHGDDAVYADSADAPPVMGPLQKAHAEGKLWEHFVNAQGTTSATTTTTAEPPAWLVQLCKDLYYRTDSSRTDGRNVDNFDEAARESDPLLQRQVEAAARAHDWRRMPGDREAAQPQSFSSGGGAVAAAAAPTINTPHRAEDTVVVDPYTWLPFDLLDVQDYHVGPYVFPATSTYTTEQQVKLCLGQRRKEYVHFCNTYCFPERWQIPTSMGTQPARLLVDPACPTPVVFLQLSPDFPPAMWLPIRPTAAAIRGVLSSFATQAFFHREEQHAVFEQRYETAKRVMELQQLPTTNDGDILRFMAYEARNTPYLDAPLREYPNQQEFFLGEYDDPEKLLEHMDLCPFLFAMPHLRTVTDPHAERMIPTIEGAGVVPSLFRCIFTKALIQISVHLSAEVKLPPQDPEGFHFLWKDSQVVPKMKIPVFARVTWPDNKNLSGGGLLGRRFNKLFQTEFAPDIPVDAMLSLFYVMQWAQRTHDFLGVVGMRQRVAELEAATHLPEPPKLYPGTREIPNPEYTAQERLGMHLQYLSHLGDPKILDTIAAVLPTASAPVRMGCAKAALIAGDRELFRRIVSSEPPGRMQHYMTKLVVKRKTRDLVDPEPRLLEDQYEFAAPLWTKRGTRIDRNTLEGAVDAARLLR